MTKSSVDQDLIRAIAELLNKENLAEIEIEQDKMRVRVVRSAALPAADLPPPLARYRCESFRGSTPLATPAAAR